MGFEYFYGFIGGDTSQWQPNLFRNTTAIYPFQNNPSWNLTTAMADDAIQYMKQLKEIAPGKPFLVYYVPGGGTHLITRLPNGSRRSVTCIFRSGLEQGARSNFRKPEKAWHHAAEGQTNGMAENAPRMGYAQSRREKYFLSSRQMCLLRTWHIQIMRSDA